MIKALKETLKALVPNSPKKALLDIVMLAQLAGATYAADIKHPDNVVCKDGVCRIVEKKTLSDYVKGIFGKKAENTNTNTLEEQINHGNVVIDFYTDWCGPCKYYSPFVEKIGEEYKNKGVKVIKVNAEKETALATKFKIRAYPTTVFLKNGNIKGSFSGPDKDRLKRKIETIFLGKQFEFNLQFKNKSNSSQNLDNRIDIVISSDGRGALEEYEAFVAKYKNIMFNAVDIDSEQAKKYALSNNGGIVLLNKEKILNKSELMIGEDLEEKIQECFFNKKIKYSSDFSEKSSLNQSGFPTFIIGKKGKVDGMILETVDNKYNYIENNNGELNLKGPIYDSSKSRLYKSPAGIFIVEDGKVYELDSKQNKRIICDLKSNVEMDIISKKPQIVFSNVEGDGLFYLDGDKKTTLIEKFSGGKISKIRYTPSENEAILKYFSPKNKMYKLIKVANGMQSDISELCYDFEVDDIDNDGKKEVIYLKRDGVFLFKDGSSKKIGNKLAGYIKIEDIDNNGLKDILCEGSQHLYWLKNKDGKNFELEYITPRAKMFKGAFDIGDLDGDGYKDIFYADRVLKYKPKN